MLCATRKAKICGFVALVNKNWYNNNVMEVIHMAYLSKYTIHTDVHEFLDITKQVKEAVTLSNVTEGIAVVYTPHTTAALTINENADPDVLRDLNYGMDKTFPNMPQYRHFENNSDAHLKSTLVSASLSLIITDGKLLLGRWQDVYFCEFDGPRTRNFYVKIIEG